MCRWRSDSTRSTVTPCALVEDPALVIGDCAIIPTMGVGSRRGEAVGVRDALSGLGKTVLEIDGTLEGGDVVQIGERVFVGLSGRTNREGISALESAIGPHGYEIVPVEIRDTLHLKSVCAYLGKGHLLVSPGHFEPSLFEGCTHIEVEDEYSVNCIELNGQVIIAEGFPKTVAVVEQAGFATRTVPTSEFRKGDGGLSCLSIRF
jgi:dimethylargininase